LRPAPSWRLAPLALALIQVWAVAAEAPITPGSVQESVGGGKPRPPGGLPQVVVPVQSAPSQHPANAKRFRVNAFDMSGNTVFKTRYLKTVIERFVDQELNLNDLNKAAEAITAFYHDRGYTLARAVIPAQKVQDGVVVIQIVEGRFGKVTFSGNKRYSSSFLAARTALLTPGALVTTGKLENNLLLLNDLPGMSAKVVLEPGAEFGATDAEIVIKERLVDGSLTFNNYGREETGQRKLEFAMNVNAPFGWGDQLAISGSSTQQKLVRYWKFGYSLPINTLGTRVAVSTSKAEYQVSGALAALGIGGEIKTSELVVSHPFVRSREENQSLSVALKRSQLKQSALGAPLSDSAISLYTATWLFNQVQDDASVTNASFALATNFKSGNDTTSQDKVFARMEFDGNHTAPFIQQWDLYLRANYVHSKERLPDTEKFSLGGPSSVRAFRTSEVRGDRGYLAQIELRRPFSVFSKMGVFRLTLDAGEVVYKMAGFNDSKDRLRSMGFGATFYPFSNVTAAFDFARATGTTHVASDDKINRLWMTVSAHF
jgi:hemolysin activation/secretion protein